MSDDPGPVDVAYDAIWDYVRDAWNTGASMHRLADLTAAAAAAAAPMPVADADVRSALDRAVDAGWLERQNRCYSISDTALVTRTLDAMLLDSASPDAFRFGTWDLPTTVAQVLSIYLDLAVQHNPDRSVEYLLRTRHHIDPESARSLTGDLASEGLLGPAARLLAQLTPTAATADPRQLAATLLATLRPAES